MFIRLTKIKDKEEEIVFSGYMKDAPIIGENFLLETASSWYRTSIVKDWITSNTFKTTDFIYRIEEEKEIENTAKITNDSITK